MCRLRSCQLALTLAHNEKNDPNSLFGSLSKSHLPARSRSAPVGLPQKSPAELVARAVRARVVELTSSAWWTTRAERLARCSEI